MLTVSSDNALTSLPNDVFDVISSDFDLADLCNLRLTSHNLHTVSTTPNFKARFHHIKTDLSLDNLQSLIAIYSSRDLNHLIKDITVLAKHYDGTELQDQVKSRTRWEADRSSGPIFASTGHSMTNEDVAEAKTMCDQMDDLQNKQAAMQADGTDIRLLTEAFTHLGAREINLSIEASVHDRPQGSRLPISKARNHKAMSERMDHSFKATIIALSNSQLQISNLNVFNIEWGGYVTSKGLYEAFVSSTGLPTMTIPQALHNIQSLTLNLHHAPVKEIGRKQLDLFDKREYPIYGPEAPEELHNSYLASLTALLRSTAHTLQHLDIRFRGWHAVKLDSVKIFSELVTAEGTFSKLSILHLRNAVIHNTDLISLLRQTPALTHLGLHKVTTPDDPSHRTKIVEYPNAEPEWSQEKPDAEGWKEAWATVFETLATPSPHLLCPKLERLEINALYLTSFSHRIYFTAPATATKRYIRDVMNDEDRKKKEWFKIQAFQEGLACCEFSGDEVHGIDVLTETPNGLESAKIRAEPQTPAKDKKQVGGIKYKVATTRPYGSPAYYQWLRGYEAREFSTTGCLPKP